MDVNLPQQGLPLSSTGEVSHAPEAKKAASSSFPRDCTKIPRGSGLAQRAAGVSSVAHQEMAQASSSMSQRVSPLGSRELDMHPGEEVRGEDSEAVTEAFHHIASQHGGREGSGSVLRTEARGVETLQQPKMGEREEAAPQEPPPSYFLGPGEEGASKLPEREPPSYSSRRSEDVPVEESQSHTLADVQEAPTDVGEEFAFNEEDFVRGTSDMLSAESASKEHVQEASRTHVESTGTFSGISLRTLHMEEPVNSHESIVGLVHEFVHSGELDEGLQEGVERKLQDFEEEVNHTTVIHLPGLLTTFLAKNQDDQNLHSSEKEVLRQGYTMILENHGVLQSVDGDFAIFGKEGMVATSFDKRFIDALPPKRRKLAEQYMASGRVGIISHEELEEYMRAGAVIAERLYDKLSADYQTFKEKLANEREKAEQAKASAEKDEEKARLRKHDLTRHSAQKTPSLKDTAKESQEKTNKKEEEEVSRRKDVLKDVNESKIQNRRSKDKQKQTNLETGQQKQKEIGREIDIEQQKKMEQPPHAPQMGTSTSPS
jgi:hypothetical protein